eukprot:TRINITY_DN178_c0_g1_i1.p1 TRINITY_DN178_c0_g1~~TRINITY_DN178_c0_g1_i1.p1  ORF type:complete len:191 (-),score=28.41 TRINITY_DN178_c0_g1_i1:50-622(-)
MAKYVFDPESLHQIAKDAISKGKGDMELIVDEIVRQLQTKYKGHINLDREWVFNNAGGAMGCMYILHGSITEYLLIFGTPIGTYGHTGRYFFVDDYFIILQGEQWAFEEGQFERSVWKPGELHHLKRGHCKAYSIPELCWALEYARGWIPTMLPFGFADTFFSTLDVKTAYRTFMIYAKCVIKELLQFKI